MLWGRWSSEVFATRFRGPHSGGDTLADQRRFQFGHGADDGEHRPAHGTFGIDLVIKSGDPVEQEKQLKYASLVANAIMLSNVADMTEALAAMAEDGHPVTPGLVACLSPYTREHIRRLGQYVLDMDVLPLPLNPQPLPFELAL
jgi:hypothetical protein